MLNTLLNSDLVQLLKKSRYVKIVGVALALLTISLAAQAYFVFTDEATVSDSESATITVNVGEMYFEQVDAGLPAGYLEANVGDVIEFYNEGSLRHSVTIDELNFDEVINPGETTTLRVDRAVEETLVNCKFHNGHDAVLTVTDDGTGGSSRVSHEMSIDRGIEPYEGDLPIRSYKDAIERLEYEVVDGVKEFRLTAEHIVWEYADGVQLESWGFAGQLPGPEIRVTEGDQVRIIFENKLPEATTVHWHGIDVPIEADGVPGVTQDAVKPGDSFTYEFTADPAGTRYYHSHGSHHGDEYKHVDMGLSGPFVIEPIGYQPPDKEFTMVLTERPEAGIYPINGRIFPNPEVFSVSEGDRVRVRMINSSSSAIHPMHLHGHQYEIAAIDGNEVPPGPRQLRNNQPLTPGEIYDVEFTANNPGRWMFHCHELMHVAGGMVAELIYE